MGVSYRREIGKRGTRFQLNLSTPDQVRELFEETGLVVEVGALLDVFTIGLEHDRSPCCRGTRGT